MSYKVLQLSPQASTRAHRSRIVAHESWSAPSATSLDISLDLGFLRSWLESDSDFDGDGACGRINWGAISGLALSIAFSASFWAGVAWIVARVWR